MFKFKVIMAGLTKKMWPKITLFALLALVSALMAVFLRFRIPDDFGYSVDAKTISSILHILASSMLAVTTFSLTIMVQAYASATTTVTPRATQLVVQDRTAQNVLATFLGTFIFSLAGIIALNTGIYKDKGRIILFATTILIIIVMIAVLVRWIDHLTNIGRVSDTTRLVEEAAKKALQSRACSPCLGCNRLTDTKAVEALPSITAEKFGYLQFVDVEKIANIAEKSDCDIYVVAMPGKYIWPGLPLIKTDGDLQDDERKALCGSFTVADERTFEQDPRFGVCVMSEIAQRALSPSVNDPGTAIDVLGRMVTVLAEYHRPAEEEVRSPRVWIQPLSVASLFEDAFNAIARDGAALYEVQARLLKSLRFLAEMDNEEFTLCARKYSRLAMRRSEATDMLEEEKEALRRLIIS